MSNSGLARYAPLAGLAFVVLTVAAFVIVGDTPDNDSTTLKVVTFWTDHKDEGFISSIVERWPVSRWRGSRGRCDRTSRGSSRGPTGSRTCRSAAA